MQITEHFSLRELTRSATAARYGVPNNPSDAEMDNIRYTAEKLESIRAYVGRPLISRRAFAASV